MSEQPTARRFDRLPKAGQRARGLSREFLYKLHGKHGGLFKKAGGATLLDLNRLDEIIANSPDAVVKKSA
jgi:hypothetical protein